MPNKHYLKYIIGIICLTIAGCIVFYYLQPSTPHKNNTPPTKKVSENPSQESKNVKVQGTDASWKLSEWVMSETLIKQILALFVGAVLASLCILLYNKAPGVLVFLFGAGGVVAVIALYNNYMYN